MTKEEEEGDDAEELEPLFDYTRVQPIELFSSDDEKENPFPNPIKKRRRSPDLEDEKENDCSDATDNIDDKESKEEWMPPPPPLFSKSELAGKEDKILRELRLWKQELAFTKTTGDILKAALESIKQKHNPSKPVVVDVDQPSKPERQKIVLSIQDKRGEKKFCMFMDDKLERLIKMYADKSQLKLDSLVFCFDGDKIDPAATPASLGLENGDIIEVHAKAQ